MSDSRGRDYKPGRGECDCCGGAHWTGSCHPVDAAEHDAGTCPSCGSAYCVGRLDYLDCVAVAMAEFVAARMDPKP